MKSDLHTHVKGDPRDPIKHTAKQLIDRAASQGFEVLAITCHDYVFYNKQVAEYAKSKNILLIPGAEKTLHNKHILIYNITNEDLRKIKSFNDIRRLKKQKPNTFVIAPHPYYKLSSCLGNLLEKHMDVFDAIEYSFFYTSFINPNKKARQIAKKSNKPLIGNSDTHHLFQIGTTFSKIHSKKDIKSIVSAIRKGRVSLITKPLTLKQFLLILLWAIPSLTLRRLKILP